MKTLSAIYTIAVLVTFIPTISHAYLDAGTGSLMAQILLGGIAGISVLARVFWNRFMTRLKSSSDEEQSAAS